MATVTVSHQTATQVISFYALAAAVAVAVATQSETGPTTLVHASICCPPDCPIATAIVKM